MRVAYGLLYCILAVPYSDHTQRGSKYLPKLGIGKIRGVNGLIL